MTIFLDNGKHNHDDDDNNNNNSTLTVQSAKEHLSMLYTREMRSYPPCGNYLAPTTTSSSSVVPNEDIMSSSSSLPSTASYSYIHHDTANPITEKLRRSQCQWLFDVVDHFDVHRNVVAIAMHLLDHTAALWLRGASSHLPHSTLSRQDYQLLSVASLSIAVKTHGQAGSMNGCRQRFRMETLCEICRHKFTKDRIVQAEQRILLANEWKVNPPTAHSYLTSLLLVLDPQQRHEPQLQDDDPSNNNFSLWLANLYDCAGFLTEASVFCLDCCCGGSSSALQVAVACVVSAMGNSSNMAPQQEILSQVQQLQLQRLRLQTTTGVSDAQLRYWQDRLRELCPADVPDWQPLSIDTLLVADIDLSDNLSGSRESPVSVAGDLAGVTAWTKPQPQASSSSSSWSHLHHGDSHPKTI